MKAEHHALESSVAVAAVVVPAVPVIFDSRTADGLVCPYQATVALAVEAVIEGLGTGQRLLRGSTRDQDEHWKRR